jgi:hypothetical protein
MATSGTLTLGDNYSKKILNCFPLDGTWEKLKENFIEVLNDKSTFKKGMLDFPDPNGLLWLIYQPPFFMQEGGESTIDCFEKLDSKESFALLMYLFVFFVGSNEENEDKKDMLLGSLSGNVELLSKLQRLQKRELAGCKSDKKQKDQVNRKYLVNRILSKMQMLCYTMTTDPILSEAYLESNSNKIDILTKGAVMWKRNNDDSVLQYYSVSDLMIDFHAKVDSVAVTSGDLIGNLQNTKLANFFKTLAQDFNHGIGSFLYWPGVEMEIPKEAQITIGFDTLFAELFIGSNDPGQDEINIKETSYHIIWETNMPTKVTINGVRLDKVKDQSITEASMHISNYFQKISSLNSIHVSQGAMEKIRNLTENLSKNFYLKEDEMSELDDKLQQIGDDCGALGVARMAISEREFGDMFSKSTFSNIASALELKKEVREQIQAAVEIQKTIADSELQGLPGRFSDADKERWNKIKADTKIYSIAEQYDPYNRFDYAYANVVMAKAFEECKIVVKVPHFSFSQDVLMRVSFKNKEEVLVLTPC